MYDWLVSTSFPCSYKYIILDSRKYIHHAPGDHIICISYQEYVLTEVYIALRAGELKPVLAKRNYVLSLFY